MTQPQVQPIVSKLATETRSQLKTLQNMAFFSTTVKEKKVRIFSYNCLYLGKRKSINMRIARNSCHFFENLIRNLNGNSLRILAAVLRSHLLFIIIASLELFLICQKVKYIDLESVFNKKFSLSVSQKEHFTTHDSLN